MKKGEKEKSSEESNEASGLGWILAVIAGVIIWVLSSENRKKDQRIAVLQYQNNQLNNELKKISNLLDSVKGVTDEAKIQIQLLIEKQDKIKEPVRSELVEVFMLIQTRLFSKAILSLGKIIENSLKTILETKPEFKSRYKNPRFVDLIDFAKESKILGKDEIHIAHGIREMRNTAAHEFGIKKSNSWEINSVMLATSIVVKLEDFKPKGLSGLTGWGIQST